MGEPSDADHDRDALVALARREIELGIEVVAAMRGVGEGAPSIEELDRRQARVGESLCRLVQWNLYLLDLCRSRDMDDGERLQLYVDASDSEDPDHTLGMIGLSWATAFADHDDALGAWVEGVRREAAPALYLYALLVDEEGYGRIRLDQTEAMRAAADQGFGPALAAMGTRLVSTGDEKERERGLAMLRRAPVESTPVAARVLAFALLERAEDDATVDRARKLLLASADAADPGAILIAARMVAAQAMEDTAVYDEARERVRAAAELASPEAAAWLREYGGLTAKEYVRVAAVSAWLPTELPPPERSSPIAVVLSSVFVVALIAATFMGNSLGPFLLLLFLAVVLHEAGHMLAGRLVGVPTVLFTVGVGPVLLSRTVQMNGLPMRIDLRLLPLLGSVRPYLMPRAVWDYWRARTRALKAGRAPPEPPEVAPDAEPEPVSEFPDRPARLFFFAGGLIANVLLAVVCLAAIHFGDPRATTVVAPVLGPVAEGSIADEAGLRERDRIAALDGEPVVSFREVQRSLTGLVERDGPGALQLLVERDGSRFEVEWPTQDEAPVPSDTDAWGLRPPLAWTLVESRTSALPVGAAVVGFQSADGWVDVEADTSHAQLEEAFATVRARSIAWKEQRPDESDSEWATRLREGGFGPMRAAVEVAFELDGSVLRLSPGPRAGRDGGPEVPPFTFGLVRERDPARTLPRAVAGLFSRTLEACLELPRTLIQAAVEAPTPSQQRALIDAVSDDRWAVFGLFAFVNAFLFFLNLLPIPPLDGFHLAVISIEGATGVELPKPLMAAVLRVGWVLLLLWLVANVLLVLRDLAVTFT